MYCCKRESAGTRRSRIAAALLLLTASTLAAAAEPKPASPSEKTPDEAVICIDPGHPSEVGRGTRGRTGLTEMRVNWLVALKLKRNLEADGFRIRLTKSSESERVTNRRRAEIANAARAALFLRLHCDGGGPSGTATYYPDRPGKTQGVTGPSNAVLKESRAAALRFHPAMMAVLRPELKDRGIMGDSRTAVGGRNGALIGSIFSKVPTLLVEMCTLTNAHDERLAATERGRELLARGLERGALAALKNRRSLPSKTPKR